MPAWSLKCVTGTSVLREPGGQRVCCVVPGLPGATDRYLSLLPESKMVSLVEGNRPHEFQRRAGFCETKMWAMNGC